jgi:ketosteroid isomerase-like protein
MNPRYLHRLVLLLGLLAVLCAGSTAQAAGIDKNAQDLAKQDRDWSNAAGQKDVNLLMTFYAAETFVYPPNEPISVGVEGVRKTWESIFADPTHTISWKVVNASVAQSGEIGYTTGTYEFSGKGSDGKSYTDKGKYVTVWSRGHDGKWLVVHDIFNSDYK